MKKSLLILLLTVFLQGCTLHPDYTRPCVEVPPNWKESANETSAYANYDWWQQFGDPILDELILEALANNNDLKVAMCRVCEFIGRLQVVQSKMYPQINALGSGVRQEIPVDVTALPPGVPRIFNQFDLIFSASYEVDLWGKIYSATEAAEASLFAEVEARRTVVLTLVSSVASTYILMRQYDMQLDISNQTYDSRVASYNLAKARYQGGLTSELEVKQAQAEMETAAAQVLQFEILIAQQENLLSVLIGTYPQCLDRGMRLDQLILPVDVPAGLPSELLEQRPDIIQAEFNLISANAIIGVARAQFFPSISLTGNYGWESLTLGHLFTKPAEMWNYGISIAQPLFTGGNLTGQLRIAEAQKCEAYYQYFQTVLIAFKEVEDALIAHRNSKELEIVGTYRVKALRDALNLANLQYNNGQTDYLNVLDVQRNLFASQLDLAVEQSNVYLSLIDLYKALGGGWVIEADNIALQEPCN